ncbi:MAG: hypothetical protein KVP17_003562 [Porospora cf. gigantea B]|uniref:uncharacterized protein n=1 Tax=Porospora cf. gigantea B TaxID=2853592 RepID=UPI003571E564|nr:MAG: hypothetical protein KVP17_003562 [Porospora cf. gigantea B]
MLPQAAEIRLLDREMHREGDMRELDLKKGLGAAVPHVDWRARLHHLRQEVALTKDMLESEARSVALQDLRAAVFPVETPSNLWRMQTDISTLDNVILVAASEKLQEVKEGLPHDELDLRELNRLTKQLGRLEGLKALEAQFKSLTSKPTESPLTQATSLEDFDSEEEVSGLWKSMQTADVDSRTRVAHSTLRALPGLAKDAEASLKVLAALQRAGESVDEVRTVLGKLLP